MKNDNKHTFGSFVFFVVCFIDTVQLCEQSLTSLNIDLAHGLDSIRQLYFPFCDNIFIRVWSTLILCVCDKPVFLFFCVEIKPYLFHVDLYEIKLLR